MILKNLTKTIILYGLKILFFQKSKLESKPGVLSELREVVQRISGVPLVSHHPSSLP